VLDGPQRPRCGGRLLPALAPAAPRPRTSRPPPTDRPPPSRQPLTRPLCLAHSGLARRRRPLHRAIHEAMD
jgi:hypothetical protein